ncbi:hypothetical protein EVAR_7440_1 [Eumeta japonica]|uniref:Uncharacterized protein n=1 Tax=Eumeta variegata TaxID=151549 RepID=A0A4C1V7U2_EUMVA|nr:hypothetical protein EVAR_7440_1 [Eumeta japonica]
MYRLASDGPLAACAHDRTHQIRRAGRLSGFVRFTLHYAGRFPGGCASASRWRCPTASYDMSSLFKLRVLGSTSPQCELGSDKDGHHRCDVQDRQIDSSTIEIGKSKFNFNNFIAYLKLCRGHALELPQKKYPLIQNTCHVTFCGGSCCARAGLQRLSRSPLCGRQPPSKLRPSRNCRNNS